MVGPLMILTMLHCKRMRRTKSGTEDDVPQSTSNRTPPRSFTVKKELPDDYGQTCRVCLKEGSIPIFGHDKLDISQDINTFAGVTVTSDDIYPKYLCQACHSLLQGAILLRKTAQQSDEVLRQSAHDITMNEDSLPHDSYDDNDQDTLQNISFDYHIEKSEYKEENTEKKKNYQCKRCEMNFDTFKDYNDHRMSEEHENKKGTCPICNQSYVYAYLKKHLAVHRLETPYMCDICGKTFSLQGQFTRHRLTHSYSLPYKCSLCPYRGRFTESLKMHMRTHTGEKPYQCHLCPSRFFINKSNLNKHLLTHREDHRFNCSQCQRGFHSKRDLDMHFKVDHSGIKDHACNICGKVFGYRKQMMKHQLKVHKREKLRSGRTPLYLIVEKKKQKETE